MRTRTALLVLVALGAVAILSATSVAADPADIDNPPTNDWFFDSGQQVTITGKVWDVNYNITVANYTHLVFDNCRLTFSDPADYYSRWISVWWNGSMTISNCIFDSAGSAKYYMRLINDTDFISSTITGMSSYGGVAIYLERGQFTFTDTTVKGMEGMHAIYGRACGFTANGLTVSDSGGDGYHGMYLEYDLDQDVMLTLQDCDFLDNDGYGAYIRFYYPNNNATLMFDGCNFNGNEYDGIFVYWYRADDHPFVMDVTNCNFNKNGGGGFRFESYYAYYGSGQGFMNFTFDNCVFDANDDHGLYLYFYRSYLYATVDIDNCQFTNTGVSQGWGSGGLRIYHSYEATGWLKASIDGCEIDNNIGNGFYFNFRGTMLDDNYLWMNNTNITDNRDYGMYVYMYNYYSEYPTFSFRNCNFLDNKEGGLFLQHDWMYGDYSLSVADCTFSGGDGGGILSDSYSDANYGVTWDISKCDFKDLGDFAVLLYLDDVEGDSSLSMSDCTVNRTGGVRMMVMNSADYVQALHAFKLVDVSVIDTDGAAVDIMTYGWYGVGLDIHLERVWVDNALYNGIRASTSTYYASTTASIDMDVIIKEVDVTSIDGNAINLGTDRVNYRGKRTIDVDDLLIDDSKKAVVVSGLKGEFWNTVITSTLNQDFTVITSNLELFEPNLDSLTEDTVQVIESGSVKFWYKLKIYVKWNTGAPVIGAVVEIRDNHATLIGSHTHSDASGLDELLLNPYQFRETGLFTRSPYLLKASFKKIVKEDSVELTETRDFTVTLADHVPPNVFINDPAHDSVQQSKAIKVRGSSFDGESGVVRVEVNIGGGEWILMATQTSWEHTFSLTQDDIIAAGGRFAIRARAFDAADNTKSVFITVGIDPFPPELLINFPMDNYQTNDAELTVRGLTEAGATVLVNGVEVPLAGTLFNTKVTLVEGPNTITVSSSDALGNIVTKKMNVVLDTKPPYLVLLSPGEGEMLTEATVDVSGQAEDGLTISVNDFVLSSAQYDNGTFSYDLGLNQGENMVTVEATDAAGNMYMVERMVLLDDVDPILAINWPMDGAHLSDTTFMVTGTTDPDAMLLINDELIVLDHGMFSHSLVGVEGVNTVIVTASDAAGNTVSIELSVTIDTEEPGLVFSQGIEGSVVTLADFTISGSAEGASKVLVNNMEYPVDTNDLFTVDVALMEGVNQFIVTAMDDAGNSMTKPLSIVLDTQVPRMVVLIPGLVDGVFKTIKGKDPVMHITGYTDDAVQVFINGENVAIREDGYFEYEIMLTVGSVNTVTVRAVDEAGNFADSTISVTHKFTDPKEDKGFEWGWLILFIGLIILVIAIILGYLMVSRAAPAMEMPEVEEEEVLAPAELPEVEEEEELIDEDEEELIDEDEEEVEIEVEEEEEVHELTPPERPRTETSRPDSGVSEAPMPEIEDKELDVEDADADIEADETDQEGI